jgi:DegV family protein with EDD domain
MTNVVIVTDSSANLPQSYIKQYGIEVVPLTVTWKGKTYRDGIDINPSEFYQMLAESEDVPITSQTTVFTYEELFRKLLSGGNEILVLPISGKLSSSVQSALQAKSQFPDKAIEVIDTNLVSMALSFQVLASARAAESGASLAQCRSVAEEAYPKIGVYFTVESLKYLYLGGRIGGAKHLFGTALNIKPILQIQEGRIELVQSVISHRKAVRQMVELVEKDIAGHTPVRVSVFHAGIPDLAQELLDEVTKRFDAVESILSEVSPVIGSHTGPGTISIAYMAG